MNKDTLIRLIFLLGLIWMIADAFVDPQPDPELNRYYKIK
jgi:hypothetical protein